MVKEKYIHLCEAASDNRGAIDRLYEIVKILRVECPWDRVQTHESLRPGMLEEAYETVDAINNQDMVNLREELGMCYYRWYFIPFWERKRVISTSKM